MSAEKFMATISLIMGGAAGGLAAAVYLNLTESAPQVTIAHFAVMGISTFLLIGAGFEWIKKLEICNE